MSSNDDQPVTDGKPAREPKRFEVHLKPYGTGTLANIFTVDCHDFREVGRYLQFHDEKGVPVAVFPASELVAAILIQQPKTPKADRLDVTLPNGTQLRDVALALPR